MGSDGVRRERERGGGRKREGHFLNAKKFPGLGWEGEGGEETAWDQME